MPRPFRPAHRLDCRPRHRLAVRLRAGMAFWGRPSDPLRLLCHLARRLLKFHEIEPSLAGSPANLASAIRRSETDRKRTDFGQFRTNFVPIQSAKSNDSCSP